MLKLPLVTPSLTKIVYILRI